MHSVWYTASTCPKTESVMKLLKCTAMWENVYRHSVKNQINMFICTIWSVSLHGGGLVLRLNDGSLLNLFQIVSAWLSMSVVGLIVVPFVVFLCSGFRSPLSYLLFHHSVSDYMWSFTDEVEAPMLTKHIHFSLFITRFIITQLWI